MTTLADARFRGRVNILTSGQAVLFDLRGKLQLTIIPQTGKTATHSKVDDGTASVHDTATKADVTTVTAIPATWPYMLITADGVSVAAGLAIDAVPEDFKTTAVAAYRVSGVACTKAATTGISFSAAHTINVGLAGGVKYGVILVQITAAGVISTKVPSADQVYASAALALAAKPAPDASNVELGYIIIGANSGASWTANTDDMTPASDCSYAAFVDSAGVGGCRVGVV